MAAVDVAATRESSIASFFSSSSIQCGRLLRRWSRDPAVMIQSIVFPAFLLLVFQIVLGKTVTQFSGQDSVYGQVPLIALLGAMMGTLSTGVALTTERDEGLLTRFWALPVHRASGVASRLAAETVRTLIATVLLVTVGVALGFRFQQGPLAAVALLLVPVILTIGFATMVIALAVISGGKTVVELFSTVCLLMLFFNTGFVPLEQYPGWLQPIIEAQPMSRAIDTMKGLSAGGPILFPLAHTIAWSVGLVVIFGAGALRGYRKAAEQ